MAEMVREADNNLRRCFSMFSDVGCKIVSLCSHTFSRCAAAVGPRVYSSGLSLDCRAMKFSSLVPLLVLLANTYGPVNEDEETWLQEDCCGTAHLSSGVRMFGFGVRQRDVSWLFNFKLVQTDSQVTSV